MLKRTQIRHFIASVLADAETGLPPDNLPGLTLAGENVYDTLLAPPQYDNESPCGFSDDYDLPAIAVFTEDERLPSDVQLLSEGCFTNSELSVLIELYACGKDGIELEMLLDSLEAQVRYKLFRSRAKPFKITGYSSSAVRDNSGKRLGLRRIRLDIEYSQNIHSPHDYLPGNLCINLKIPDKSE